MKTCLGLLSVAGLITVGCVPEDDLGDVEASATATIDQRFAVVASRAPAFGGMFIDDDGKLAVHVRGELAPERTLAAVSEIFPEHALAPTRVINSRYEFARLSAWHDEVVGLLALPDVVFTDLDERQNRVSIGVANAAAMAAVEGQLESLGIPRDAVMVEMIEPILNVATLRDFVRPLEGGLQIRFSGFLCTLGFNATRAGVEGFVVNSHCTDNESTVDNTLYYQPLNQVASEFIGTEIADPPLFTFKENRACPHGKKCRASDAAFARRDPNASAARGVLAKTSGANNNSLSISGTFNISSEATTNALVGETVNKVGRTTGWTQGTVTNRCVNTGVSGSSIVRLCQDWVSAGVGSGDSGSPVFRIVGGGVELKGILWGGSSSGGTFVYSPLHLIEQELGALATM